MATFVLTGLSIWKASVQLEYNKLRQQAITSELLDILGGQVK